MSKPTPPENESTAIIRPLPHATPSETSSLLVIEHWAITRLLPYRLRLRKNDHAVDRMIASIAEFEFKIPVLVSAGGEIIDGHLRLKAAQQLGFTEVRAERAPESEAEVRIDAAA